MTPEEVLEKYNKLKQNSNSLDKGILESKKSKISTYLKNVRINDSRVNNNLYFDIQLYSAPVREIYNSTFIYYYDAIYLDKEFISNPQNTNIVNCQLTHEILHCLNNDEKGRQYFFGHLVDQNYIGIDEATTQLFTEDIEQTYLTEQQDSRLYFIKNIMRILKIVFGQDLLFKQYLNINNEFENTVNNLMNNEQWIKDFALMMTKYYTLKSQKLDLENIKILEQEIIAKIFEIIDKQLLYDSTVYQRINNEFANINSNFLYDYNIITEKSLKI